MELDERLRKIIPNPEKVRNENSEDKDWRVCTNCRLPVHIDSVRRLTIGGKSRGYCPDCHGRLSIRHGGGRNG